VTKGYHTTAPAPPMGPGLQRSPACVSLDPPAISADPPAISADPPAISAAASFLAFFLATFRRRRSRTAFSRLSLAIVVFLLELEAMHFPPFLVEFGGAAG